MGQIPRMKAYSFALKSNRPPGSRLYWHVLGRGLNRSGKPSVPKLRSFRKCRAGARAPGGYCPQASVASAKVAREGTRVL
jgi:hypothetical protein